MSDKDNKNNEILDFLNSLESLSVKPGNAAHSPNGITGQGSRPAPDTIARKSEAAQNALAFLDELAQSAKPNTPIEKPQSASKNTPKTEHGSNAPEVNAPLPRERSANGTKPSVQYTSSDLAASVQENQKHGSDAVHPQPTEESSWSSWGTSWLSATQETLAKATTSLKTGEFKASAEKLRQQVLHSVETANIDKLRADILEKTQTVASNLIETVAPTNSGVAKHEQNKRHSLLWLWVCTSLEEHGFQDEAAYKSEEKALGDAVEELARKLWQSDHTNDGGRVLPIASKVVVNIVDSRAVASLQQVYDKVGALADAHARSQVELTKDHDHVDSVILVCKKQPSHLPNCSSYYTELFFPSFFAVSSQLGTPSAASTAAKTAFGNSSDLKLSMQSQSFSNRYMTFDHSSRLYDFYRASSGNALMCAIEDLLQECRLLWDICSNV